MLGLFLSCVMPNACAVWCWLINPREVEEQQNWKEKKKDSLKVKIHICPNTCADLLGFFIGFTMGSLDL